jgi:hypothetical protein
MGLSLRRAWWLACATAACSLVLAHAASADTIQLSWNPNSETDVKGYVVYAGTASGVYTFKQDVGAATSFIYPSAVAGQKYFFAVTAYSAAGESPRSAEVSGYSNVTPVMSSIANQTTTTGTSVTFNVVGSDALGEPVTYKATGLPPGLILTQGTGLISGTPTRAGTYPVTVTISDGLLSSSQTFTWTVAASTKVTTIPPVPTVPPVDTETETETAGEGPVLTVDGSTAPIYYVTGPRTTYTINGVASGFGEHAKMWYLDNFARRHDIAPSPSWSVTIKLVPGRNLVQAWLKEPNGDIGTVRLKVFYTP